MNWMNFASAFLGGGSEKEKIFQVVAELVRSQGGLEGVLDKFRAHGLDALVESWIGKGDNLPLNPDQLRQALTVEKVEDLGRVVGLPPADLEKLLTQVLPHVIDHLTPDGHWDKDTFSLPNLMKAGQQLLQEMRS